MTINEARDHIEIALNKILSRNGHETIQINDDLGFLNGDIPIDSLDLAVLLTNLEEATKKDPFQKGFVNFSTVGDLAKLYAD